MCIRDRAKDSRRGFESDAEPLATMEELRAYASAARALGVRGAARAVRALGLMPDNSNSPKESCVGILLALPRVRGGAGVPGFRMNVTIRLPEELADTLGRGPSFRISPGPTARLVSTTATRSTSLRRLVLATSASGGRSGLWAWTA